VGFTGDFTAHNVSVGGEVIGGSGDYSGGIAYLYQPTLFSLIPGDIFAHISIGGSLIGGLGNGSGAILAGSEGAISIGGDLVGASISDASTVNLDESGYIQGGHIGSISIGGSIYAGSNTNTGPGSTLTRDGSIRASQDIGSITVGGSLIGAAGNPVIISAVGLASVPKKGFDTAIGSLTVAGRVELANILAGYDPTTNGLTDGSGAITGAVDPEASIGSVKIGGAWVQSNLVAGAQPGASNLFGESDNTEIGGSDTSKEDVIARIASILIGGQALGGPNPATDHYGFVAEEIGKFSLGGTDYAPQARPRNDDIAIGATADVTLLQVS
jgi:hypothetical protein